MARIEKTVFISYRRSDVYTALAVYQDLKNRGYDVFFDYRSVSSGDFEQIITSNIRARAHFLLILTPTALDRLNEMGDWLRREIEIAIDEKRNIVPLFFKGFRFGSPSLADTLTGKLKNLSRYNGLNVHEDYFDEAMHRLRTEYLNRPLDTILHPVSNTVQKIVKAEQVAADKALEQIEDVKELVGRVEEQVEEPKPDRRAPIDLPKVQDNRKEKIIEKPDSVPTRKFPLKPGSAKDEDRPGELKKTAPRFSPRVILGGALLAVIVLAAIFFPALRNRFAPGIGSTMISEKDGMTLVYVPAGEFMMGSDDGSPDEQPVHTVALDAFWIDKTEVTNAMYANCVNDGNCKEPSNTAYYADSNYAIHPVVYVSWEDAVNYCSWANRRLPTEAEWEKAASWNDPTHEKYTYPWGNDFNCENGNFNDETLFDSYVVPGGANCDGFPQTSPVGSFPNGVSPYGALDMAGNVWEWLADWYDANYYATVGETARNPQGPTSGQYRVLRGGAWIYDNDDARSANREGFDPSSSNDDFGFRCAMSATP